MKLTRKKAIALCISLWTWLAKTGKQKEDWPEWPKVQKKYGYIMHYCFFCAYHTGCMHCPYYQKYGHCRSNVFDRWYYAKNPRTRKKYAGLFLAQIQTLE